MADETKNPPEQPEFGELAPEGWSWNPEANAPHTPETLKAAEVAAKAAAKAQAAHVAATAKATERGSNRGSLSLPTPKPAKPARGEKAGREKGADVSGDASSDASSANADATASAATSAKATKAARSAKPAKTPAAIFVAPTTPDESASPQALSEAEKKMRAVALARQSSDRFITWGLLGIAVFSVITGLGDYLNLTRTLNAAYDQLNTMEPGLNLEPYANLGIAKLLGWAIVMTQAVIMGLTFWWAIRRMRAGKMAFWVPVIGFAVSSAAVLIFLIVAFVADPTAWNALLTYIQSTPMDTSTTSPNA